MNWPRLRFRSQPMPEYSAASPRKQRACSICNRNSVISAERLRDYQQHYYAEHIGERQHDEHVRIAEVFERDDHAGRGIALRGAEPADVFEMVLSHPRKVAETK